MKTQVKPDHINHKIFCNYCPGYCCYKTEGASLLLTATDINRLARYFEISDGSVRKKYIEGKNTFKTKEDGSCIFLADNQISKRCSIHLARPDQCKNFPYEGLCPYLYRADLMETIVPRVEKALGL